MNAKSIISTLWELLIIIIIIIFFYLNFHYCILDFDDSYVIIYLVFIITSMCKFLQELRISGLNSVTFFRNYFF